MDTSHQTISNKYRIAVLFGASHGINDFIAGYLLAHLSLVSANQKITLLSFLVYSVIAFGGQLPAGLLVDKLNKNKAFTNISLLFMIAAIATSYFNIFLAIFLSAIASAFIHVCGASACYLSDNKNFTLAGIFTSPGVIGLISGGILGATHFEFFYVFICPLILLLISLIKSNLPENTSVKETLSKSIMDVHDFVMLFLLIAIAARSLLWNLMHVLCFKDNMWLLALAFSAGFGKITGALLADLIDWKKLVFISSCGAIIFLNLDKNNLVFFCIGVFMLQSAVPVTLLMAQNYLKGRPAAAAGLSLGLAILVAGLPAYSNEFINLQQNDYVLLLLSAIFFISNFWMLRHYKNKIKSRITN